MKTRAQTWAEHGRVMLALLAFLQLTACANAGGQGAAQTEKRYLSGTGMDDTVAWDFYCTSGQHSGVWTKIAVPSCWEQQGFGSYDYGVELRGASRNGAPLNREQGKYRLDFTVPATWQGKLVRLVFEGSMTDTEAWVNGQLAGPVHQGSFYRFSYDITGLVKFGESNRLEVTVSKESANASVNRAERRGDYWNFGGIFRPVYLEVVPVEHIEWTAVDARADGTFLAQAHLGAAASAPETVTAQLFDARGQPVGAAFSADVAAGADTATLRANFPGVKLWTAETPNLYQVRLTLADAGGTQHTVTERFGFRTIELRAGDGFYLNGQRIILKGINRHSFWPETGRTLDRQICYDDAKLIKDLNMNAVRMSHYPPDRDFLEACDELGIYVLDELGGWSGNYDTPTGQKLIGEMVRRDVNHPSILFWDNGNEGGWDTANDGEFAKWDPQQRHVFHPRSKDHGVNDPHYPTYEQVVADVNGPQVYFPTEFLHAIYDGGGGSGLHDYWAAMKPGNAFGGAIFWAFLDESVARTDENGKLDSRGNLAPDGIMGPHREKEGSYYTIKQIWSPVQVAEPVFAGDTAEFAVENDYDFTNLNQCTFVCSAQRLPQTASYEAAVSGVQPVIALPPAGAQAGPDVAPHATGKLVLALPAAQRDQADVLYVSAMDPAGRTLWTWSWPLRETPPDVAGGGDGAAASSRDDGTQLVVTGGNLELRFSKDSGELANVSVDGKPISLGAGPHFIAYQHLPPAAARGNGPTTKYRDVAPASALTSLTARQDGTAVVVEAKYSGALEEATWRVENSGAVRLDYTYAYDGTVDMLGVNFDYPESLVKGITWEGWGPYRTWQNRIEGTTLGVWHNAYNDNIPSVTWIFPEFKGYFRGWRWAVLDTAEGSLTVTNGASDAEKSYLGVYTPHDGPVGPLLDLPKTGLAFLDVIPANRDKFKNQDQLGPQSRSIRVAGEVHGTVHFNFAAR